MLNPVTRCAVDLRVRCAGGTWKEEVDEQHGGSGVRLLGSRELLDDDTPIALRQRYY